MDFSEPFKALADGTRRRILQMLQETDMSAGDIADAFDISKPSVSHHLNVLKRAGLVSAERDGQHIIYSIDTTVMQDITLWMLDLSGREAAELATEGGHHE